MCLLNSVGKRLAAGAFGDPPMQSLMKLEIQQSIPFLEKRIAARRKLLEFDSLPGSRQLREQPRCLAFERLADCVMPADIFTARNPHASSGPRPAFEKPFKLQLQQRLGYGKKAHAELCGNTAARNRFTQGEFTSKNAPTD